MAELKSGPNPLFLREQELRTGIDLLLYAHRNFMAVVDSVLEDYGLGRAHYRVVYFVGRHPSISVGELLGLLRITKQSLSRVVAALVARGLLEQRAAPNDRRKRLLTLTSEGEALERALTERQTRVLAQAYRRAGAEAVEGFRSVLSGLMEGVDPERAGQR